MSTLHIYMIFEFYIIFFQTLGLFNFSYWARRPHLSVYCVHFHLYKMLGFDYWVS